MLRLAIGLALVWSLFQPAVRPQDPAPTPFTFHSQAPKKLRVKVTRVQPGMQGLGSLVEVRVSNPTSYWAEPLEFRMPKKGRPRGEAPPIVPRVAAPYATRAGRAIPPKGELRYWINVPAEERAIVKSGWVVTAASFFERTGAAEEMEEEAPPIEVGRITAGPEERTLQGHSVPFSRIELHNRDGHPVDVILRARFEAPKSGDALIQCRLEPGERRTWTVEGPCFRYPGRTDVRGSKIAEVELVDWSRLTEDSQPEALAALRQAWDRRARWPQPNLEYRARYRAIIERWDYQRRQKVKVIEEGDVASRGGFADFTPDAPTSKASPGGDPPRAAPEGWVLLNRANQWLGLEPFETWRQGGRVLLHKETKEETILAVTRQQASGSYQRFYWLVDGDWVGESGSPWPAHAAPRWWTLESSPHGQLPTLETDWPTRTERPEYFTEVRFEFKTVQGVPLPTRVEQFHSVRPAEQSTQIVVEITKHELDVSSLEPKRGE